MGSRPLREAAGDEASVDALQGARGRHIILLTQVATEGTHT
jgi:hypothetical protein